MVGIPSFYIDVTLSDMVLTDHVIKNGQEDQSICVGCLLTGHGVIDEVA